MNTVSLILLGILVIVAFIVLWSISTYNSLVSMKALADEGWSGVDVQLKRRYDLIPNLIGVVEGYKFHEKDVLEAVTNMRSFSMHATGVEQKAKAEHELSSALKTLFAVAENYPALKASENFLALQQELSSLETDIQLARRYYNGAVRNYNIAVEQFPSMMVARFTRFSLLPFFELTNEQERQAPRVKF